MARSLLKLLPATLVAASLLAPSAGAVTALRPPVTWLKGEGNFTKSHRSVQSIDHVVVHVTEGKFWGSVRWLKSPRAHASSHFVISRAGKIVQLVHTSDIAWHAGNWKTNVRSVGIEHEGFTYGPDGFTAEQYRNSAKLTAWIARRALMPIDRKHIIGHAEVPGPRGGRGGASHHTDPGPRWNWNRYLALVRAYARGEVPQKLSVVTQLRTGPLAGLVPWRAETRGGVRRVEFVVDGRVVRVDGRAPFAFPGGLDTVALGNGSHVLELRAYGEGTRHDVTRRTIVVSNRDFALTTAGASPWTKVRGTLTLRSRVWGAKATQVSLRVDGRVYAIDRRAPFTFTWRTKGLKNGKHALELVATALDGRVTRRRIPVVTSNNVAAIKAKPRPQPKPVPTPKPVPVPLRIVSQTVADGAVLAGLVLWRVELNGAAEVDFLIDGIVRGSDLAAPYTFGWNADAEAPGEHRLTARARGNNGRIVEATIRVTVPAPPSGSAAP